MKRDHKACPSSRVESRIHLVLDSRLVHQTGNARLVVAAACKDPANPLFLGDRPWEVRLDNVYANLRHDAARRRFQCWYSPFIVDDAVRDTPPSQRRYTPYRPRHREMGVCYAESEDGLHWQKPAFGLLDLAGNRINNLVARGVHGAGVFCDTREADPRRRYKMLCRQGEGGPLSVAFSGDGSRWSDLIPCPAVEAVGDTHNVALWAPDRDEYVGFTRLWDDGQRLVGRTASPDFLDWSKASEVLRGDETNQIYAMPVFRYGGVYLGLASVFRTDEDRVHCELVWSPDTLHWERIDPGTPLIANGAQVGTCDWGCVYAAASPVVMDDEIRLYYGASDGAHGAWRTSGLALARLRLDGFAGYEPERKDRVAVVQTRPILCDGAALHITAGATAGAVEVEVWDEAGCRVARGTSCDKDVTRTPMRLNRDLTPWRGKPLRLRFSLRNARLYAWYFGEA